MNRKGLTPNQVLRNLRNRQPNRLPYAIVEPDGTTLVELAPDEDTAFMFAPSEGRTIRRDGIVRYVARDGGWVWAGVRTA